MARYQGRWLISLAAFVVLVVGASSISGCGSANTGGSGRLAVVLADAPATDVTAVNVTIERVEAHIDGVWTPINTTPLSYNLLDLAHQTAFLGEITLPPGLYTQIRLFLGNEATVTDEAGTHPLKVPSAAKSGLKIDIQHEILPGARTTLLLDFDVNRSLVRQGNGQYLLNPVIPATVQELSGSITGRIVTGEAPLDGAMVTILSATGEVLNLTFTRDGGRFTFWGLEPGTYTINARGFRGDAFRENVVVGAGGETNIGDLQVP